MRLALAQARAAACQGEVPVGAVVCAADGRILGAAGNAPLRLADPTAHAEILAMRKAAAKLGSSRLSGCLLVVTLEPCPMCAGAAREARLAGLVYGAADPLAGAVASRAEYLAAAPRAHAIWHMGGILSGDCAALLGAFFAGLRQPG